MRKKHLRIIEADVYRVGLSLSEAVVKEVKHSLSNGKFSAPLAETIPSSQTPPKSGEEDASTAAVTLCFVRAILSSQTPPNSGVEDASIAAVTLDFVNFIRVKDMVQAFDDALLGCEKAAIAAFSQGLNKVIHKRTYFEEGDKLRINWRKSGGVILMCGDKVSDVIYNKELSRRLLEVYVDDERSVSKDLIKCIKDNVHEVETN